MLLDIKVLRGDLESKWFITCAKLLHQQYGCQVLPRKRYLRPEHVSLLLGMNPEQVLYMLMQSKKTHGFIYKDEIFVHPIRFSRDYLQMIKEHIDKSIIQAKKDLDTSIIH